MRKVKAGLFLSIELIAIIIVVIAILAMVVFGLLKLMENSDVTKIINEYREYSFASINFKNVYGYWPGDVPSDVISDNLGDGSVKTLLLADISTIQSLTLTNTGSPNEIAMGNGYVGNLKSDLVFRQLKAFGLISSKVDLSSSIYALTAAKFASNSSMWPRAYEIVSMGHLPKSSANQALAWQFLLTPPNNGGSCYTGIGCETIYSDSKKGINKKIPWGSAPRLILFRYADLPNAKTCASSSGCSNLNTQANFYSYAIKGINPVSTTSFVTPVGALSAKVAYHLDKKIDDGLPNGIGSFILGSDVVTYSDSSFGAETSTSVLGCTSYGANALAGTSGYSVNGITTHQLTGTTSTDNANKQIWLNNVYSNSETDTSYKGCVMMFSIFG